MSEGFSWQNEEFGVGSIVVGRYLVEAVLGRGGQGVVVKALDTKNFDNPVVIKALLDEVTDKWSRDKFESERRALARLQGASGIVNLLDSGKTERGRDYTVLEFIEGYPLTKILKQLPGNLTRAAELFRQSAAAVHFAHQKQIYHRDLKPDNLMISHPGTRGELVKVVDFGIAKQTTPTGTNIEMTTNIVGTPFYIAPNVFDGNSQPLKDDIYALGLIAYEMVTGSFPLEKDDFISEQMQFNFIKYRFMQAEMTKYPPSQKNPELSAAVDEIILKALSENPSDRYDSAEEFGEKLHQALLNPQAEIQKTQPLVTKVESENPPPGIVETESETITSVEEKPKNLVVPIAAGAAGLFVVLLLGMLALMWFLRTSDTPIAANTGNRNSNLPNVQNSNVNVVSNSNNSTPQPPSQTPTPSISPTVSATPSGSITPADFTVGVDKKDKNNQLSPASFDETFKAGDGIRINIYSDKSGSLQIFLKGSDGTTQRVHNAKIQAGKTFVFPRPQWIFFDNKPGTETIYTVITEGNSPEKISVDELDAQSGGKTEFTTTKGSAVRIVKLNHGK
jgi:serine/threonine protein kinase